MIAVLDYGMGNIHSIVKALALYSPDVKYTANPDDLKKARALVLPGDGAFGAAMQNLRAGGLDGYLREAVELGKPLLGICIGFQVLFEDSSEATQGLEKGLGLCQGHVRRFAFSDDTRIPHMGWNRLIDAKGQAGQYMYFVHSYHVQQAEPGSVTYSASYGGQLFTAAIRQGSLTACQFHPEKSGPAGLAMIQSWVESI